ncbi:hypothetical protein MG296_07850 [Flavobacteriaceae bacterium TK19130]|nr:hypothetical protein [Thermobacterium salinum]
MKYLYALGLFCTIILWSSCRNDFETVSNTGNLEFSTDTVYLDTIFSNIGSSTYTLKVYNRSDEDINIPSVRLGEGESSNYRLNVDGVPGKEFQDVRILAEDSIFVFVETTADIETLTTEGLQFLYTDQIQFDTGGNQQNVELVTLVQDAVFLFPEEFGDGTTETLVLGQDEEGNDIEIEGFFLDDDELTFTNEKPYVIYGYAAVPPNRTLTVEAGARVHFHAASGILVAANASMQCLGATSNDPEALENEIIFEGDRLEPEFSDVPGQWGTIWLTAGSTDHLFRNTTIKNGVIGLRMDSNDGDQTLQLENVQLYNHAVYGLYALTGNIYGENVVVNNCGQSSLACLFGGTYEFNHCTFANYWTNSFRSLPAVQLGNVIQTGENSFETMPLNIAINNSIIYGNEQREIGYDRSSDAAFNFNIRNTLIRFEDPSGDFDDDPLYDFSDAALYNNIVRNQDPVFFAPEENELSIETGTSSADGIADPTVSTQLNTDITGTPRDGTNPDAGAYESVVFPDPEE